MLDLKFGSQFRRDRSRCVKRGYDMKLLSAAVETLRIPAALPTKNHAHSLTGILCSSQKVPGLPKNGRPGLFYVNLS